MTGASAKEPPRKTGVDLVEYIVLTVPARQSLEQVAESLRELSATAMVRLLDVVVLERDDTGSVDVREIDDIDELRPLMGIQRPAARLLSTHDIELVAPVVPYGSVGLVVVTEDKWAAPLLQAVTQAGGSIVAGERIPAQRVESTRRHTGNAEPGPE